MVRTVPASTVKQNFGQVLKRVYEDEETQIIERAGLPVAAIITIGDLERLYPVKVSTIPHVSQSLKRQRAAKRLMGVLDQMQKGSERFTEEEVEADVKKAVSQARHGNG